MIETKIHIPKSVEKKVAGERYKNVQNRWWNMIECESRGKRKRTRRIQQQVKEVDKEVKK